MARQIPRGLTLLAMVQPDGTETLGVKLPGGVLDVTRAGAVLKMDAPTTLEELLVSGQAGALEKLINAAKGRKEFISDEADIKFGRMFTKPGKIVCVGLNYREHVEEAGREAAAATNRFQQVQQHARLPQLYDQAAADWLKPGDRIESRIEKLGTLKFQLA